MSPIQKTSLSCLALLFVIFTTSLESIAQTGNLVTKCYGQMSAGGGSFSNFYSDLSLETVFKNKWSVSFMYQDIEMKPNNVPNDYIPASGEGLFLFIPYSYTTPVDNINMHLISLTGGRYFKLGRNTWATTEGGLSFVKGEELKFKSVPVTSGSNDNFIGLEDYTTSNYETTHEGKNTIGAMVKADVNWAFASFMGIGAGVYGNFNSIQSPVGFHFKLMIGFMGKQKKHSH
jgi:hypothetical protein